MGLPSPANWPLVRRRNEAHATIAWRFTTSAARTTLRHLYPTQQNHLD